MPIKNQYRKDWEILLNQYDLPDEISRESALIGQLDHESNLLIKEYSKAIYKCLEFRQDNHLDLTSKELLIKFFLMR